jgi:hypothetical protein
VVDVVAALIDLLEADTTVDTLTSGRIYGNTMNGQVVAQMPAKCVIISHAPGREKNSYVQIAGPGVEVYAHGESFYEAGRVDRAVYDVLEAVDRKTINGVLIHGVAVSGGPNPIKHPETGWPIMMRAYRVSVSEIEVT